MLIIRNRQEINDFIISVKSKNLSVGLVPTKGNIHQGNISLIKKSIEENQYTICSIFSLSNTVNNPDNVRVEEEDIKKLNDIGCDVVYIPRIIDIYPQDAEPETFNFHGLDSVMEGYVFPGIFERFATTIKRLFLQIQPTHAYFGEKDFQQLQIIKQVVKNELFPISIVNMPTVREANGIVISSQNLKLNDEWKKKVSSIYQILPEIKKLSHETFPKDIPEIIKQQLEDINAQLEYFLIAEEETLKKVISFEENKKYRAFIAVSIDNIRLTDNLQIK